MIQDYKSIVPSPFFIRPLFSRHRSPFSPRSDSSPLSLPGPPLYIVCLALPVASALFETHHSCRSLQPAEICGLLKVIFLCVLCHDMCRHIDVDHIVKSQSVIKLYIMFNMLKVADKFSSFDQDILDALYWAATEPRGRKREHFDLLPHLCISLVYVFIHSLIVLIQATTLNVAINSQNKALLTIMLSNYFIEFKKNGFQEI
ncbi:transmembrane anterior posterior transformation protein 1 homolog [Trichonephila clavipes]|nr:transmembrane anterior posterior transformation protein 1 homolog [Trichonephila clavipes]